MLTEWMVHPEWMWTVVGGLTIVVLLLAVTVWQNVDETEK